MPVLSRNLDPLGWLKWLWRSSIGSAVGFLVLAALFKDFFFAIMAVGCILSGLADYVDRSNRWLWWALVGTGNVLFVVGICLFIKNCQS